MRSVKFLIILLINHVFKHADSRLSSNGVIIINPQLRYVRQIRLFQPLKVDVVLQVERILPAVAHHLLDELSSHTGPEEVSTVPMPAARGASFLAFTVIGSNFSI